MRQFFGLRRGDRIATVLFNHDQTVFIYFAAWVLGLGVVPISVEETVEKKRYILEHSEATVCFCWQDYEEEIRGLLQEIDSLAMVVTVNDETHRHGVHGGAIINRKVKTRGFWRRLAGERVTCVSVVPTLLEFLLEANEDLSRYRLEHFRGVICGAGPLLKETAGRFEETFGFPIRHG